MSYARINRGPMAADVLQRDFTQIHNRLFRDPRLSFKAKGIFGLISTHRNGYGVTPEWIAKASTDGPGAVRTGLRELEKYGYLMREQERNPDGTMGPMTYSITDMPSSEPVADYRQPAATCGDAQKPRSEPVSDYPHAAEPHAADCAHKKTSSKETSGENTNRPSVPDEAGSEENGGGTDGAAVPSQISRNEGVDLLLALGAEKPEFLLTGKPLRDQGLTVTGMLAEGWTAEQLRQVIAGRKLPDDIHKSVGALVAGRLKAALTSPVPCSAPSAAWTGEEDAPTPTPDAYTSELINRGARPGECEGNEGLCGRPTDPGARFCRHCINDTVNA